MKVEFASIDEKEKHYSIRTVDGRVHFGREYLDSCFLKTNGNQVDLHLDLARAKEKIQRKLDKQRKFR